MARAFDGPSDRIVWTGSRLESFWVRFYDGATDVRWFDRRLTPEEIAAYSKGKLK